MTFFKREKYGAQGLVSQECTERGREAIKRTIVQFMGIVFFFSSHDLSEGKVYLANKNSGVIFERPSLKRHNQRGLILLKLVGHNAQGIVDR